MNFKNPKAECIGTKAWIQNIIKVSNFLFLLVWREHIIRNNRDLPEKDPYLSMEYSLSWAESVI